MDFNLNFMNQQKLEKELINKIGIDAGEDGVGKWIAVYINDLMELIQDNYIPKAEVEHLIIQAEAKGAEQAIETFEKVPKPNSTN